MTHEAKKSFFKNPWLSTSASIEAADTLWSFNRLSKCTFQLEFWRKEAQSCQMKEAQRHMVHSVVQHSSWSNQLHYIGLWVARQAAVLHTYCAAAEIAETLHVVSAPAYWDCRSLAMSRLMSKNTSLSTKGYFAIQTPDSGKYTSFKACSTDTLILLLSTLCKIGVGTCAEHCRDLS